MTPSAYRLPDTWNDVETCLRRAFGIRMDEFDTRLRSKDAAETMVPATSPSEYEDAWRRHVGADHPVTIVNCRPTADLPCGAVLTSPPLATARYTVVTLDEHCPAFDVHVTITTSSAIDMAATLPNVLPRRTGLDLLVAEEALSVTLTPEGLVVRRAPLLPEPSDPLPGADELLRAASPHFDGLDERVVTATLASLADVYADLARLRGRMTTYLAYDIGRGLSFREARKGGDFPTRLDLALAELASHGATPRLHHPPELVGAYSAARTRRGEPPGIAELRTLAADGTFVGDGALADFTRWQAARGAKQLWLFRADGTHLVVRASGYKPGDRRVKLAFAWSVGEWLECWTRSA